MSLVSLFLELSPWGPEGQPGGQLAAWGAASGTDAYAMLCMAMTIRIGLGLVAVSSSYGRWAGLLTRMQKRVGLRISWKAVTGAKVLA